MAVHGMYTRTLPVENFCRLFSSSIIFMSSALRWSTGGPRSHRHCVIAAAGHQGSHVIMTQTYSARYSYARCRFWAEEGDGKVGGWVFEDSMTRDPSNAA